MEKNNKGDGLASVFKQLFSGFNEKDATDNSVSFETGHSSASRTFIDEISEQGAGGNGVKLASAGAGALREFALPRDRMARYDCYQDMARYELVAACLQMHLAYALAPDMATGNIINITSKDPEFDALAKEINEDLGGLLNKNLTSWAWLMCIYGVHYVRPIGVEGKGVTDIESNYFTLAKHIKEYMRGDRLSGFTSEYLKEKEGEEVRLAEPWALVPLKIPFWSPDLDDEPISSDGQKYSLYTENHRRTPIETQNYGTSFLESSYVALQELKESTKGLRGARYNASRVDRFIAVGMEGLDPVSAARYLNNVGEQMRKDEEAEHRIAKRKGIIPTFWNKLLPILAGKGGVTIDTQQTSPDINGIEDTMFCLKRFCASMGIDPTMIGWGDMMQGGLGEGGWARTSINAALKANWIRIGIRDMALRTIDIHLAYKYRKVFPANKSPFVISFHSINTALAIEKADEQQAKVDYATAVTTVLDMINQGSLNHSETFKKKTMLALDFTDDDITAILDELEDAPKDDGEGGMFESVSGESVDQRIERLVMSHLDKIFMGNNEK